MKPTNAIMSIRHVKYKWHEFFPNGNLATYTLRLELAIIFDFAVSILGKLNVSTHHAAEHNYGAVVSLWLPVILVYFS